MEVPLNESKLRDHIKEVYEEIQKDLKNKQDLQLEMEELLQDLQELMRSKYYKKEIL